MPDLPRYRENVRHFRCVEILTDQTHPEGEWVRAADVDGALVKSERVFQAVVYAFEGKDVPEDLLAAGMVRRALKYREQQQADVAALQRERDEILLKDSIKTREINLLVPEVKAAEAALTRLRAQLAQFKDEMIARKCRR